MTLRNHRDGAVQGGDTARRRPRRPALALLAILSLAACHSAKAPGMDPNDLSDDRGARAGRFRPPADSVATANDTDHADDGVAAKGNQ